MTKSELIEWISKEIKSRNQGDSFLIMGATDDEIDIPELVGFFKYNYIDLSEVKRGDIKQLCEEIKESYNEVEWILFDNIDKIRKIKDREDWEYIVKYVLRNEEYEMRLNKPGGELLVFPFDKLRVISRCSKWPDYLEARTLNCLIFDFNQFNNN